MGAIYGGIEAGGTKFVCAVGTGPDDVRDQVVFPTTTPDETISRAVSFFQEYRGESGETLAAVGIGAFGPLDPDPRSPAYGSITSTPKPGWTDVDFAGTAEQALGLPVAFDTDVNAAALGELTWGAARGVEDFVYLTVGTGIGGGAVAGGRLVHGLLHPEMGHMRIPHDVARDPFPGVCPFHGDCLEGLASGPALRARWACDPAELPAAHPGWRLEAEYLALGIANLVLVLSPRLVLLGGGVMRQPQLLDLVRDRVCGLLAGYLRIPSLAGNGEQLIQPPALGERAGVLGALALARRAAGHDPADA